MHNCVHRSFTLAACPGYTHWFFFINDKKKIMNFRFQYFRKNFSTPMGVKFLNPPLRRPKMAPQKQKFPHFARQCSFLENVKRSYDFADEFR